MRTYEPVQGLGEEYGEEDDYEDHQQCIYKPFQAILTQFVKEEED